MSEKRPYIVGLTGGIGSGKSAATDRFAALGASVVDTDRIAHELTAPGGGAIDGDPHRLRRRHDRARRQPRPRRDARARLPRARCAPPASRPSCTR